MGRKKLSKQEFENRIKCIFNGKYKLIGDFIDTSTKVNMLCDEHGVFSIYPKNMLYKGEGCKLCGIDKMAISKSLTRSDFIEKANKLFNNKYDYTESNYINNRVKIFIICKKCGNGFWKTPNNHLKGQGCPYCN